MRIVAPSILAADFTRLGEQVLAAAEAGADLTHVDVMDGCFVPNISVGIPVVQSLAKIACPPMDVHLMIKNPEKAVASFARAGGGKLNNITVQAEACRDTGRALSLIRSLGIKAGVAINPSTPISSIEGALPAADIVLIMSVEPGFSGQNFMRSSLEKIKTLREFLGPSSEKIPLIEVDGGIDTANAAEVFAAGADAVAVGAGIFGCADIAKAVRKIKSAGRARK